MVDTVNLGRVVYDFFRVLRIPKPLHAKTGVSP
jgi:hypothetical protein